MKMSYKITIPAAICLLAGSSVAFADNHESVNIAQLAKQVQQLEAQTKQLKMQLAAMQKSAKPAAAAPVSQQSKLTDKQRRTFASRLGGMPVTTSPYLGVRSKFDGSDLLVMVPSVLEDLRLLHYRRHAEDALNQAHIDVPDHPYIKLSGGLEALVQDERAYNGKNSTDASLDTVEIDTMMGVNNYVTGYLALVQDVGTGGDDVRRVKNSRVFVKKGFITIGNLNRNPFYLTLGQTYPAFGRYSSAMISAPLTMQLGRIHGRVVNLGYSTRTGLGVYGSVFAFNGETDVVNHSDDDRIQAGGANLDYVFDSHGFQGDFGVSFVTNLAESELMSGDSYFHGGDYQLNKRVPGVDFHAMLGKGPINFLFEYVGAGTKFDQRDMQFNGRAARPWAINTELGYNFDAWGKPSNISIGYGQTHDAYSLDLPEKKYLVALNTSIFKDTIQVLEFSHSKGYGATDSGTLRNSTHTNANAGKHANAVIGRFGIYF